MSITDELRDWADDKSGEIAAIADRIDAEHESKVSYWQGASYKDGYDEGFASADDWLAQHEDAMAEHGWVRLPKDADGELILDGDKMVSPHGDVFIVTHMMLENGTWTVHGWKPSFLHHHKSPVEDVLYELTNRLFDDDESATDKELIAEYAKRLRLKDDE